MTRRVTTFAHWTLITYECHGRRWEKLLSRKFPERLAWRPMCPVCGESA